MVLQTCSNPGKVLYIAICTSSGKEELIPCTYISSVSLPRGSINTWCLSLSANKLSKVLEKLNIKLLRFKTGTPARVNKNSIDFSKMEIQNGERI